MGARGLLVLLPVWFFIYRMHHRYAATVDAAIGFSVLKPLLFSNLPCSQHVRLHESYVNIYSYTSVFYFIASFFFPLIRMGSLLECILHGSQFHSVQKLRVCVFTYSYNYCCWRMTLSC